MDLLCDIYALAEVLPGREQFVLTQQLCKAALSIPSNIAEGRGRGTKKDFRHFVQQARGSLYEVETQITAAQKLGYIGTDAETRLLTKSNGPSMVINGLIRSLGSRQPQAPG